MYAVVNGIGTIYTEIENEIYYEEFYLALNPVGFGAFICSLEKNFTTAIFFTKFKIFNSVIRKKASNSSS
ncbi:hypothetical protein SAMN05660649_00964 [Desulfotomaculum arcticum]|uniref:Uncharacterized protein n=1 Tax=Desulfotruncus arcticus DSM 17038 TaxID=1121424 RepID=A0A1I2PMS4_9FIRM|nr:hypothetical protein SAMN05660649_00964 [Desulfotomaculum arcticum] [Desulfotruncus arcticus DSM 17038]